MTPGHAERRPGRGSGEKVSDDSVPTAKDTPPGYDALAIARSLAEAGVRIFLAKPDMIAVQQRRNGKPGKVRREWDPTGGHQNCGYWLPDGWQKTVADPRVLDHWEPGMAVCAVMGGPLDCLDYDPRNGGSRGALEQALAGDMPSVYGLARTPSGGTHELIAATGLPKGEAVPGVDHQAGKPSGSGRGFVFIAPTIKRSKVTGEVAPYEWVVEPDIPEDWVLELDLTGAALRDLRGASQEPFERPAVDLTDPATAQQAEAAERLLARLIDGIRESVEGNRYHTWWGQVRDSANFHIPAVLIFKFIAGGCLDAEETQRQIYKAAEESDWDTDVLGKWIEGSGGAPGVIELGHEDPDRPHTSNYEEVDVTTVFSDEDDLSEMMAELGCEDGPALFDEVVETVRRYFYLSNERDYHAMVLWVLMTYAIDHLEHAPRLSLMAPEKRCGKTRGIDCLNYLVRRPLTTMNATVAAIVRSITVEKPPTLLIDEADTIFGSKRSADNNEDLRGVLNAGHARGNPILRWNMNGGKSGKGRLETLETFAPVALAGIGVLPDTIRDRAIEVDVHRRPKDVMVQPFRKKRDGERVLRPLAARIKVWADAKIADGSISLDAVAESLGVEDRAADNWEPLVILADTIGGEWPARARAAAIGKTEASSKQDSDSDSNTALRDLRRVWPEGATRAHSSTLVDLLRDLEESPWAKYGGYGGLDQMALSSLLRGYKVRTKLGKVDGVGAMAYHLEDQCHRTGCKHEDMEKCDMSVGLAKAWSSYLGPQDEDEPVVSASTSGAQKAFSEDDG